VIERAIRWWVLLPLRDPRLGCAFDAFAVAVLAAVSALVSWALGAA
jgi:hypothetical protein